ncbi:hypothetical protein ACFL5N_00560 [bacterium]
MNTTEKRYIKREKDKTLSIAIELSYPKANKIVKPIEEISAHGLSLRMFEYEGYFQEGTILKNIKIFNHEHESTIPESKVIYCRSYRH